MSSGRCCTHSDGAGRSRRITMNPEDVIESVGEIVADYAVASRRGFSHSNNNDAVELEVSFSNNDYSGDDASGEQERIPEGYQNDKLDIECKWLDSTERRAAANASSARRPGTSSSVKSHSSMFSSSGLHALDKSNLSRGVFRNNEELVREIAVLEREISSTKSFLDAARAENNHWAQKYEVLSNELQLVRELQEGMRRSTARTDANMLALAAQASSLKRENASLLVAAQRSSREREEDAQCNRKRQVDIEQHARGVSVELRDERMANKTLTQETNTLCAEISQRDEMIENLCTQVRTLKRELDDTTRLAGRFRRHEWQIRNDHLRVDNARLLELLKSTDEYKSFCDSLVDIGDDNGVSYIPNASAVLPEHYLMFGGSAEQQQQQQQQQRGDAVDRTTSLLQEPKTPSLFGSCHNACKSPNASKTKTKQIAKSWAVSKRTEIMALDNEYNRSNSGLLIGDKRASKHSSPFEEENWAPREAIQVAAAFRHKCAPHVSLELVAQLLRELNKVWQHHQINAVAKLQKKHKRDIYELKRRAQQSASYDQVMRKQKVERLEKTLRSVMSVSGGQNAGTTSRCVWSSSSNNDSMIDAPFSRPALEKSSHLNLTACLQELEEVSSRLQACQEDNAQLRVRAERSEGFAVEIELATLASTANTLLLQISGRMRETTTRVTDLSASITATPEINEYLNLVTRAYTAMMEDVDHLVERLRTSLKNAVPSTPINRARQDQLLHKARVASTTLGMGQDLHLTDL